MHEDFDFDGEAEMKTLQEVHDMLVLTGYKDEAESVKQAIKDSEILDWIEKTGSVSIQKCREGFNGPIRWDVEYADYYESRSKVNARTALHKAMEHLK